MSQSVINLSDTCFLLQLFSIYLPISVGVINDLSDILKQFHHAIRTIPSNGNILFHNGDENIMNLIEMGCWSNTHKLGSKENIKLSIEEGIIHFEGQRFDLSELPMHGRHNLNNAVMAMYASFLNGCHRALLTPIFAVCVSILAIKLIT